MKKTISKKSNKEMSAIFREVGEWFMALPKEAEVDMVVAFSKVEVETCRSPACFGGWLATKYSTKKDCDGERYFSDGACAFAKELGFSNSAELSKYAYENPEIWGNVEGGGMFSIPNAFDEGEKKYLHGTITTKAIGEKLIAVADRLIVAEKHKWVLTMWK